MNLLLSPDAIQEVRNLTKDKEPGTSLRLFVDAGGCSGLSYGMELSTKKENDLVIPCAEDVSVYVDSASTSYLDHCRIEYSNTLTNTGFRIINPNARATCGCGTSFEA